MKQCGSGEGNKMDNELFRFLKSMKAANWMRIVLTIALTTMSVSMAFKEATTQLIVSCNIITVAMAFAIEYKNYKTRQ